MGDSAKLGPSAAPMTSPIAASPTSAGSSSDEAMLWEQFLAPDKCCSTEIQLYRLLSLPASPPTDLLSLWLSKYLSASPYTPAEDPAPPPPDVLAFLNSELDETDLGVWDPASFIPNTPEPTLLQWVETPGIVLSPSPHGTAGAFNSSRPAPSVVMSPCSPPVSGMQSKGKSAGVFNSSGRLASGVVLSPRSSPASGMQSNGGTAEAFNWSLPLPASTSTMPALAWNQLPISATQFSAPGLLLPFLATASTQAHQYSPNPNIFYNMYPFGFSGHQYMSATQDSTTSLVPHAISFASLAAIFGLVPTDLAWYRAAPNANSVAAMLGLAPTDLTWNRAAPHTNSVAVMLGLPPTGGFSADDAWNRAVSHAKSVAELAAMIGLQPTDLSWNQMMIPARRLSWDWQIPPVAAPMPLPLPPLLTSSGSPPSWNPRTPEQQTILSFQRGESSTPSSKRAKLEVSMPKPLKKLLPKVVTQSVALKRNKNQKASLGSVANFVQKNAKSRERLRMGYKTLQKLVTRDRKVDLLTLLEMTCNYIIIMEYQIQAQKVGCDTSFP